MERLIRVDELSKILSIGRSTAWKWVAENKIPKPIKLSPRVSVWKISEIMAFIDQKNIDSMTYTY